MTRTLSFAAALSIALAAAAPARAADLKDDEAKAIAVKVTTAGATLFDAKDAAALTATFTEDGRIEASYWEKDAGKYKVEVKQGRTEVETFYKDLFKGDASYHAKSTIEYARQVGPNLIMFAGYFVPDTQATDPMKVPFIQVRSKQGEEWRVVTMQVFIVLDK